MMPDGVYLKNGGSTETSLLVSNGTVLIDNNTANAGLFVSGSGFFAGGNNVVGGLAVGSATATPDTGAIHLQARTSTVTPWPTGAQLWAQTVGGVQKLYVKFGNGTVRELASA